MRCRDCGEPVANVIALRSERFINIATLDGASLETASGALVWFMWDGGDEAVLDGRFTADELEAIAWGMRNLGKGLS